MQVMSSRYLRVSTPAVPGSREARIDRVALRRLLWAGPVAVIVAVAATLAAWAVAVALLPAMNPAFVELQAQAVAMVTSVLCTASLPVFALVARFARRPLQTFQVVSAVALVLSWLPDLMILSQPGVTIPGVVALMVLHVVAAVAMVWTLCTLTRDA